VTFTDSAEYADMDISLTPYRIMTAVDIITQEHKICVWGVASDAKELQKIVELPVNVPNNGDRCWHDVHVLGKQRKSPSETENSVLSQKKSIVSHSTPALLRESTSLGYISFSLRALSNSRGASVV